MKVVNLYSDEFGNSSDRKGWRFKAAMVGKQIGGELIGAGLYEVEPGNKLWPYHTHHANEEWLLVLRGQPTLRTPEDERQLDEGDVVCFPRGKSGAHQVWNGTGSPVRLLMLSTLIARTSSSSSIQARSAHAAWQVNSSCSAVLDQSSTTGKVRSSRVQHVHMRFVAQAA